ncbi:MAG: TIGR00725 family protein [Thermoanaerobaculia bacterium]
MPSPAPQIAVVGGSRCTPEQEALARAVGAGLARSGVVLVCGGGSGVMAAASAGARAAGGLVIGILPGSCATESPPNPDVTVPLYTGLGQARNVIVVLSAQAVIAIAGSWGTLSEIALARRHGRSVVLLESWRAVPPGGEEDAGLLEAGSAEEAVRLALASARMEESRR